MKQSKIVIAVVSILLALYFFIRRFDIVEEAFKFGLSSVPFGQLLLPIILLVLGIILLTVKKKENEK